MIACYSDRLSANPGEIIRLSISSDAAACSVTISRIGKSAVCVKLFEEVRTELHPTPLNADREGCDWPCTLLIEVESGWTSGYYAVEATTLAGERASHFFVVKALVGSRERALLVLSTNTYQAYNWWGGCNAYCDMQAVMSGAKTMEEAARDAAGRLSSQRPFSPGIVDVGPGAPRYVNGGPRGFMAFPPMEHLLYFPDHGFSLLDGAAGFVWKWEHAFVAWCEAEGVGLDYVTDFDLDADPTALDGYRAVIIVGHSEYWSLDQRLALERHVDGGGGLAIFSGNTSYWKVRWDDDGRTLVCHKLKGFVEEPNAGIEASHFWSHPAFDRPEAALTGLSFLFGGYHRLGLCVARGTAGYTVYDEDHWALEGSDLFYGDTFGGEIPLLGYENDGCRLRFEEETGRLAAVPMLGVPAGLEVIAMAPAQIAEDATRGYPAILTPENIQEAATVVYGSAAEVVQRRLLRGHAVMASFRRGDGIVFNAGTTEWAHALKARDPYVEAITRNVLRRFGAMAGANN